MLIKTITLAAIVSLIGCSNFSPLNLDKKIKPLTTLYDYSIVESKTGSNTDINTLVKRLRSSDVIFVGEFHSHQASHLLQLQLLKGLYEQNNNIVLSMEQFTRDNQNVLNKYLSGEFGEQTLIKDGKAWEHYKGSYRAIVEFAREHNIPVIAANAPAMHVRCVGLNGAEALVSFPEEQKAWSAQNLDLNNEKYKAKFLEFISQAGSSHGQDPEQIKQKQMKTFAAQLLRDTTMSDSIIFAQQQYPKAQIIHLNGAFHSDARLGTVAELEAKSPDLTITVISPVTADNSDIPKASAAQLKQGDFVYLLKALPQRYLNKEKQNESIRELIKSRMGNKCEL